MPEIGAVILAAGKSSRMENGNKLLLPWKNSTILENVIREVSSSGCDSFIVVVNEVTQDIVGRQHPFVVNENFEQGMTSSIQVGVRALNDVDAYMICPGDLPLIKSSEYANVMASFGEAVKNDPRSIIVPLFRGQKGHPVIFSSFYRDEILNHREPEGCSGIIKANKGHVLEVELDSDSGIRDIDTREQYHKFLSK